MKGELNIDALYAFIARDDDGTEGLAATFVPGKGWMPMVGAEEAAVRKAEPIVQAMADASGKTISLVRFSNREELKQFAPNRCSPGKAIRLGGEDSSIVGILKKKDE